MWFKVYAVESTQARPLTLSSVAYVEVLDAKHHPVLQGKVALKNATGQGSFALPTSLASGSYTVRAYTSWMQNFGPEGYFHGTVTVLNTAAPSGPAAGKDPVAVDAQFFPEGGHLVQGLRSKVAFKVTGHDGRGVAAEGKVLNPAGGVVATFKTLRLGMGNFTFTPATAQGGYTAVLTLGPHRVVVRPLPPVYAQGYALRLEDTGAAQLTLAVSATTTQPETIFLLGHSRQKMAVAIQAQLVNGRAGFAISKNWLPPGVSHFTVFNAHQQPLCERLYFQPPKRLLGLSARADKAQYALRDKVQVQVAVPDQPAHLGANWSMAVYRLDSLNATPAVTIDHYLWLTSELRGAVENPDYYFSANGPEVSEATDNLLLTQGWSRFRWEDILSPAPPPFAHLPEPYGLVIRGQLTQAGTDRPRPDVMTYLSSPSRIIRLSNSLSNANGLVQFEMPGFYGSREIVVQTDPQQDSTCRLTILDPFSSRYSGAAVPPFLLAPSFRGDYAKRHVQNQIQNVYTGRYHNRYAAAPVDSLAFYGTPTETYWLDKYTRFEVLEEVLREYVPGVLVKIRKDGFHLRVIDQAKKTFATFDEDPMVLLDGVPLFNINKVMALSPLKLQKLEVIDNRYFHGLALYNGLVSFTTYKGDLAGWLLDPRVLVQQYEGVQRQREFYAPRYETPQEKQNRLPDLRNLLYWNPAITTSGAEARNLAFYTGDQAGRYLVVLQGLSANGLAGHARFTFEVKRAL